MKINLLPKSHSIRRIVLLSIFIHYSGNAFSQSLSFKTYDVDDGLPSSTIYAALQDSKGFMWFASDLGVCKFDGNSFINYTTKDGLSGNEVLGLFEDSTGKIWFQTLNGKVSYFLDGGIINSTRDTTLRLLDAESNISGMIEDADGNIWITSFRNGIANYTKNKSVHRFFNDGKFETINCILPSASNRVLLIARYGVYDVEFNSSFDAVTKIERLNFTLDRILHLSKSLQLDDHEILFSDRGGVYSGNVQDNEFGIFLKRQADSTSVYNLCQDDDYVWICSSNGVIPYLKEAKTFLPAVLKNFKISSVFKDREGNYWITTLGDGVFFCSSNAMYSYTAKDGLVSDKVTCLAKDQHNKIWIGYEKGVVSTIGNNIINSITVTNKTLLNSCRIHKIHFIGNKCWIATSAGLFLIENDRIETLYSNFRDVIEYTENDLLLASGERIFMLHRNSFDAFKSDRKEAPSTYKTGWGDKRTLKRERSKAFFSDSNSNLWISTEKRLYRVKNDSLISVHPEKFNDKLSINDFAELPNKTLLMATNRDGVVFVKDGHAVTIGEEQGLSSGICNAVSTDEDGVVWVATNKGLNEIAGYPDNIKIETYNIYDGLLSNEIGDVLVLHDTVWCVTKRGINFFHKDRIKRKKISPFVFIDNVTVHGNPVRRTKQSEGLVFDHTENDIGIKCISPIYNSIGDVLYRYKLHKDSPWKYTHNPFIYLPELHWGDYDFIVAAKGRSKIWSKEASIHFTIRKPFWRTNIFIGAMIALFSISSWIGAASYFGQQKTKVLWRQRVVLSELRTLRALMNPHFIFNALNSIQELFLKSDHETAQDYLSRFGKLMRSILDNADKISVTIAEEIESITNYLELEQLRTNGRFTYSIEITHAIDIHTTEIPGMIIQPFIENAIWHGFRDNDKIGQLTTNFSMDTEDKISIIVRDNGIGRTKSIALNNRNHTSKGIKLVKERIDILNFGKKQKIEFYIKDLEDEHGNHPGTQVEIKIPLL